MPCLQNTIFGRERNSPIGHETCACRERLTIRKTGWQRALASQRLYNLTLRRLVDERGGRADLSVAICINVNDGLVLASDSAASVIVPAGDGEQQGVVNIYNNAEKICNLWRGKPIGMVAVGAGSIGPNSVATLAKDLRVAFTGKDKQRSDWELNEDNYTIEQVAGRVREFMYEEHYIEATKDLEEKPYISFMVAAYSSGASLPEVWEVNIVDGECAQPTCLRGQGDCGVGCKGLIEPVHRLILGFGPRLRAVLAQHLGVPDDQVEPAMAVISSVLERPLVYPGMPIQDAINLAEFLVDLTIRYAEFMPGAPVVGGPIDIAAITKHEGFKWIRRKHYYPGELNPPVREGQQS